MVSYLACYASSPLDNNTFQWVKDRNYTKKKKANSSKFIKSSSNTLKPKNNIIKIGLWDPTFMIAKSKQSLLWNIIDQKIQKTFRERIRSSRD